MKWDVVDAGAEDSESPDEAALSAVQGFKTSIETRHGSTTQPKRCYSSITFDDSAKGGTSQPVVVLITSWEPAFQSGYPFGGCHTVHSVCLRDQLRG